MGKLFEPSHPIWIIFLLLAIGVILWLNATKFDHTEVMEWIQIAGYMIGAEGIRRKMAGTKGKPDG
jgi:hypothetical protein